MWGTFSRRNENLYRKRKIVYRRFNGWRIYRKTEEEKRIERKEIVVFRGRSHESSFFLGGLGALYSGKVARASMRGRSLPSLALSPSLSHLLERNLLFYPSFFLFSLFLCAPFDLHTVSLSGSHHTRASFRVHAFVRQSGFCDDFDRLSDFLKSEMIWMKNCEISRIIIDL